MEISTENILFKKRVDINEKNFENDDYKNWLSSINFRKSSRCASIMLNVILLDASFSYKSFWSTRILFFSMFRFNWLPWYKVRLELALKLLEVVSWELKVLVTGSTLEPFSKLKLVLPLTEGSLLYFDCLRFSSEVFLLISAFFMVMLFWFYGDVVLNCIINTILKRPIGTLPKNRHIHRK